MGGNVPPLVMAGRNVITPKSRRFPKGRR
jgi:hypothetical protein